MPIRPQDTTSDRNATSKGHKIQRSRPYGKDSLFDPAADQTDAEEYKKGGLPETTKYTVDKTKN